jgi:predicted PurR-regulated permease PerM
LLGAGIAFILNRPVMWFEEVALSKTNLKQSTKKLSAVIIVFVTAILIGILLLAFIIPNLIDSIKIFIGNFSSYMNTLEEYLQMIILKLDLSDEEVNSIMESLNLTNSITTTIKSLIPQIADYSFNIIRSILDFIISLASAFYILMDKQNLVHGIKVLNYSLFSKDVANYLTLFSYDAKIVFEQYIVGNLLDSFTVGLIAWLGCMILRVPYAPMIGFIVGITNVIPVFGPFLGAVPVIIMLLIIQPISAVVFGIFILVLQQIDGNILKPIILGDKLGLSGFWILFSVTVGGSLFGIVGMFLAVPVFALIYAGIKDLAEFRLEKKQIVISDEAGIIQ